MDIEITDKTKYNFSTYDDIINNNNSNNYNLFSNKIEDNNFINIFPKNKKSIYALNQPIFKKNKNSISGELTLCEGRLLNDLAEFKRSKIVGKLCQIKLYDYKKLGNNSFELIIEFVSFFSVKFIFDSDYPCSPPIITYDKGIKMKNVFDDNGNVLIESIKKANWTPSIWLSTLVYSIELLISSGTNLENNWFSNNNYSKQGLTNYFMMAKRQKYGKRKWDIYINEFNEYYRKEYEIIPDLEKNLKQ
jgi:ubiquitin-protein ligase